MMKLYIFLFFVIMFFGIAGCPSDHPAAKVAKSHFSFKAVTPSEGLSTGDNPVAIPEASTLLMVGSGLVGLAGFGRKMIKKYMANRRILPGLARHVRNVNEKVAIGALYLATGILLVAQEMLLTMRAGKFEITHNSLGWDSQVYVIPSVKQGGCPPDQRFAFWRQGQIRGRRRRKESLTFREE